MLVYRQNFPDLYKNYLIHLIQSLTRSKLNEFYKLIKTFYFFSVLKLMSWNKQV